MSQTSQPWHSRPEFLAINPLTEGTGSFGTVWKAQHAVLGIQYAIKQVFIDKTLKYFAGDANKLFREVKLLQAINHPNIVRYFYFWLEGPNVSQLPHSYEVPPSDDSWTSTRVPLPLPQLNFLFIQMELCNETLKKWMADHPTVENRAREITNILIQVTTGLKAIHEQKIIHRDLKPDNIFKLGNTWKIGDFGLSTKSPDQSSSEASRDNEITNSTAGCHIYRSPEVQNTMKSDVYTLGLIFLQILIPTFKPYTYDLIKDWIYGTNPTDLIKKHVPLNYLEEYAIISQMLNPSEESRPDSQTVVQLFSDKTKKEPTTAKSSKTKSETNILDQDPVSFEVRRPVSNFTGRVYQLSQLHKAYKQRRFLMVISGLGGVGKTELVKNFASNFFKKYQGNCLWMESENEDTLIESVKRLAAQMKLGNTMGNTSSVFRNIYAQLNSLPTLLIFDNVDSVNNEVENLIRSFRNLAPGCEPPFIIITTRNREVISLTGGESLDLHVLDDNEALELITTSMAQVNPEDATKLCKTLQNFPLAMQQAICFINYRRKIGKKHFGIADYLKLFEEQKKKILDHRLSLADHDYSLTTLTTWNMSFDSIKSDEELGPIALELLDFWAYDILNPEGESLPLVIDLYENFDSSKTQMDSQANRDLKGAKEKCPLLETIHNATLSTPWKKRKHNNGAVIPQSGVLSIQDLINAPRNTHMPEMPVEIDLMDDDRLAARSILLIQTYSICNLELRYVGKVDKQFITIHRLVQKVIRVSKSKIKEFEFLQTFLRYLLHPTFRTWSHKSFQYKRREQITKSIWPFFSKHDLLVPEFANVFTDIWRDCVAGYVPFEPEREENVEFLSQVQQSVCKLTDESNLNTMVVQYFYLIFEQCKKARKSKETTQLFLESTRVSENALTQNVGRSGFEPIRLFQLFQKQNKYLPVDHLLRLETLDRLLTWINERGIVGLGGTDNILAVSNAAQLCLDLFQIFTLYVKPMSKIQLRKVLNIVAHTLEGFVALNDLEGIVKFAKNVLQIVENRIDPSYIYVLQYIIYFISIQGREQDANEFLTEMRNTFCCEGTIGIDKDIVQQLITFNERTLHFSPLSLSLKILSDALECIANESLTNLSCSQVEIRLLFNTLIKHRRFEFVTQFAQKGLNICATYCSKEKHEQVLPLLQAIQSTEKNLWEAGGHTESVRIGQQLPKLCKFQKQLQFPNLIGNWIDNITSRIQTINLELPELFSPANNVPQLYQDITQSINSKTLPHHLGQKVYPVKSEVTLEQSVVPSAHSIVSHLNDIWNLSEFQPWQEVIQTSITEWEQTEGFADYMKPKIAQEICKKFAEHQSNLFVIPIQTLQWAFLFVLENHPEIMGTRTHHIIQLIVDNLKEQNDQKKLVLFGQIVSNLWRQANTHTNCIKVVEVPNFFYSFLCVQSVGAALRELGNYDDDLKITRLFLGLKEDVTISEIYVTQKKVIEYYVQGYCKLVADLVLIPAIVHLIDQFCHHRLPISVSSYYMSDNLENNLPVYLNELIESLYSRMRVDGYVEGILTFSQALDNAKDKSEVYFKLGKRYSLKNIIKDCVTGKDRCTGLLLIERALNLPNNSKEFTQSIESELNSLVNHLINFHLMSYSSFEEQTVVTALKCGSVDSAQIEILVQKILQEFLDAQHFGKIYDFGVRISLIPKSKLRQENVCLKLILLVVNYLKESLEIDVEKTQRIFKTKDKCQNSERLGENNLNEFATFVDDLFSDFHVTFQEQGSSDEYYYLKEPLFNEHSDSKKLVVHESLSKQLDLD